MTVGTTETTATPLLSEKYLTEWSNFVGQVEAREMLTTSARAAKLLDAPMDHVLITSGTPGVGKTTIALLTAVERGTRATVVSGALKFSDARALFANLEDGDVIVWDEIHQAVASGAKNAEWLLHFLHDGVLVGPRGVEQVAKVTILGCTTDAGRLQETILDRFSIIELVPYSEDEATLISRRMAIDTLANGLPEPTWPNCRAVARAASQNPRLMRDIWKQVRNYALVNDLGNWIDLDSGYDLGWALSKLGLTEDGLTVTDRRYLVCLLETFGNEPAGETALKDQLQEPGGLASVERRLMDKGLIQKTRQGRILTQSGIRRIRLIQTPA